MTACTRRAVAMVPDCFSSDDIEATARRTGFVQRASKMTGQLFLALVTFGAWRDAHTSLAQWAAQVTQLDEQQAVSPAAISQRMPQSALAFLQDLLSPALAKVHALTPVCDAALCPACPKGYLAESRGFELPNTFHALLPGAGGSAAQAGATMQAVWDEKSRLVEHWALPPGTIPEQKYLDRGIAFAHQGGVCLFD
jgi:hypothetical protein